MKGFLKKYWKEIGFLGLVWFAGLWLRLFLRLGYDPHLLTSNADIWYRICIAQYFSDYGHLPQFSLRYLAYGQVPTWYPPVSPIFFSLLGKAFSVDLPTVCSRIIPFFESLTPLPFFFLVSFLYNKRAAVLATVILALVPSFVYWTGIATPQSLTLFLIPIYILMFCWRNDERFSQLWAERRKRLLWILGLGALLAINFLTHLTFFLALIVVVLFAVGLKIERRLQGRALLDLIYAVVLSQVLTVWWWLPKNLYWWWVRALVTSSGTRSGINQLIDYGFLAGGLGIVSVLILLFILCFRRKLMKPYVIPILLWMLFIFLETQSQDMMALIKRLDLTWSPLIKPLEGFRFFCFLAQPLSLLTALVISEYDTTYRSGKRFWRAFFLSVLIAGMFLDIGLIYRLPGRWERAGINLHDYRAALWFRENSKKSDRIIADYYRGQMFGGVTAGRALMGGLFPLRNVKLPYVSRPAVVQDDIYTIYATNSASEVYNLMQKYGATHIYYFKDIDTMGGFGSKFRKGYGVKLNKEKFKDNCYFEEVYRDGDKAVIIKLKSEHRFRPPEEMLLYEPFLFEGEMPAR